MHKKEIMFTPAVCRLVDLEKIKCFLNNRLVYEVKMDGEGGGKVSQFEVLTLNEFEGNNHIIDCMTLVNDYVAAYGRAYADGDTNECIKFEKSIKSDMSLQELKDLSDGFDLSYSDMNWYSQTCLGLSSSQADALARHLFCP